MNSSVLESGYQSQVQQLEKRKVRRLKTRVRVRVQIDYSTKIFETYTYDLSVEGLSFYGNGQLIFPN
ncbi:MAG: hypothetical protein KBD53_11785, partial [Candidatus Omnitrophica bacterium]|nr:hypothetical protein [Candidatus Omnitrophota bacterium]